MRRRILGLVNVYQCIDGLVLFDKKVALDLTLIARSRKDLKPMWYDKTIMV